MVLTAGQSSASMGRSSTDGGEASESLERTASSNTSAVVVQRELRGMRPQPHDVDLVLALVVDPGADQLLAEHIALREERVIRLERVERLGERPRHLWDLVPGLFEQVEVGGLARLVALLDPVEPGHQH